MLFLKELHDHFILRPAIYIHIYRTERMLLKQQKIIKEFYNIFTEEFIYYRRIYNIFVRVIVNQRENIYIYIHICYIHIIYIHTHMLIYIFKINSIIILKPIRAHLRKTVSSAFVLYIRKFPALSLLSYTLLAAPRGLSFFVMQVHRV